MLNQISWDEQQPNSGGIVPRNWPKEGRQGEIHLAVALSRRNRADLSQKPVDYFWITLGNPVDYFFQSTTFGLHWVIQSTTLVSSSSLSSSREFGQSTGLLIQSTTSINNSTFTLLNQSTTLFSLWRTSRLVSSVTLHKCFRDSFFTYTETRVIPISVWIPKYSI